MFRWLPATSHAVPRLRLPVTESANVRTTVQTHMNTPHRPMLEWRRTTFTASCNMDELLTTLSDIYSRHEKVALVVLTAAATLFFTKVLPFIWAAFVDAARYVLSRISRRARNHVALGQYLNWVVLQNQDLNLTGVVGHGDKPRLEQVFLSLKIHSTESPVESAQANKPRPTARRLRALFQPALRFWGAVLAVLPKPRRTPELQQPTHKSADIFCPKLCPTRKLGPLRQWAERYLLSPPPILILMILLTVAWPLWSTFIAGEFNTVSTGWAGMVWTMLISAGILMWTLADKRIERLASLAMIAVPLLALGLSAYTVIHRGHIPIALSIGILVGLCPLAASRLLSDEHSEKQAEEIGRLLETDYLAVLGKPGSGKSTFIQYLALTFARAKASDRKLRRRSVIRRRFLFPGWLLPIPIPLRKIASFLEAADPNLVSNLMIEAFRQRILPSGLRERCDKEMFLRLLQSGKCLFLFDGLDEVADDRQFQLVIKEILGLVSQYPGNKFVVTSRFVGWRGGVGASFRTFEVEDLTDDQVNAFTANWCLALEENRAVQLKQKEGSVEREYRRSVASDRAADLQQALRNSSSLRALAENPLLLSIICFVHSHKALPEERLSLYIECSKLLLVQWDREKGIPVDDTKLTLGRKETIMQEIAFALHSGKIGSAYGRKEATSDELLQIVSGLLHGFGMPEADPRELFDKLVSRSGIIVVVEQYSDRYAFSHLTFQEFYSAQYLFVNHVDPFDVMLAGCEREESFGMTSWWSEVLALYGGLKRQSSDVVTRLLDTPSQDRYGRRLRLAAQCLAESIEVSREVSDRVTEALFEVRFGRLPARTSGPQYRTYLLRFASHQDFYERYISWRCSRVAGTDGEVALLRVLCEGLSISDLAVQSASLSGMLQLWQTSKASPPNVEGAILSALQSESSYFQLRAVAYAIALTGRGALSADVGTAAIRVLIECLGTMGRKAGMHRAARYSTDHFRQGPGDGVPREFMDELRNVLRMVPRVVRPQDSRTLRTALWGLLAGLSASGPGSTVAMSMDGTIAGLAQPMRGLASTLAECLAAICSKKERAEIRHDLENGLRIGTGQEQAYMLTLLYAMFKDRDDVVKLVLSQLSSPFSDARYAAALCLLDAPQQKHLGLVRSSLDQWLRGRRTPGLLATWWSDRGIHGRARRHARVPFDEMVALRWLLLDRLSGNDAAVEVLMNEPDPTNEYIDALIEAKTDGLIAQLRGRAEGVLQRDSIGAEEVRTLRGCADFLTTDEKARAIGRIKICCRSSDESDVIDGLSAAKWFAAGQPPDEELTELAIGLTEHKRWAIADKAADLAVAQLAST